MTANSRYLIISQDGRCLRVRYADHAGLVRYLEEASEFASDGGWDPEFVSTLPVDEYGCLSMGNQGERAVLILKVEKIVVPEPVTMKWAV